MRAASRAGLEPGAVIQTHVGSIPEPSTWVMMALGFACLGRMGYRKPSKAAA